MVFFFVPVASIIWLGKNLVKSEQFHSVFHLCRAYERETAQRAHHHTMAAERRLGREEGKAEGLREMLARQLAKRFGELPSWASDRVAQAELGQLELYLEAVLTASSLETALQLNA